MDNPHHDDGDILSVLKDIRRDMRAVRLDLTKALNSMADAESEVPEKMRRFMMYMHDVHDIVEMYKGLGHEVPAYVNREMERCDDRYRQLLDVEHTDGGTFEKVRREMASDPNNRWDHTRLLPKTGA